MYFTNDIEFQYKPLSATPNALVAYCLFSFPITLTLVSTWRWSITKTGIQQFWNRTMDKKLTTTKWETHYCIRWRTRRSIITGNYKTDQPVIHNFDWHWDIHVFVIKWRNSVLTHILEYGFRIVLKTVKYRRCSTYK